jgi:hypothetical protein
VLQPNAKAKRRVKGRSAHFIAAHSSHPGPIRT